MKQQRMILLAVLLALLLGGAAVPDVRAQTANCIITMQFPVFIEICHDGNVIDQVDDGFGGTIDVYLIESLNFSNLSGAPWRFTIEGWDVDGTTILEWNSSVTPNESGERNIAPPKRVRSFPLRRFGVTLIKS